MCLCEERRLKGNLRGRIAGVWLRSAASAGGGGNLAKSLEGPTNSFSLVESRERVALMSGGRSGVVDVCVGVAGDEGSALETVEGECWYRCSGSVPDRLRDSDCRVEFGDTRGCGAARNCAAEADGRSIRRGATDPTVTSDCKDAISSSPDFLPLDDTADPFSDGVSVDVVAALPLRCRSLYFSIASASRSRMRLAMGDRLGATVWAGASDEYGCGVGEGTLNRLLLPAELAEG